MELTATTSHLPAATIERARARLRNAHAENTRRAYQSDFADFSAWCLGHGVMALPASPETVAVYLSDRGDVFAIATLERRLAAIAAAHRRAGVEWTKGAPVIRDMLRALEHERAAPPTKAAALMLPDVAAMVATLPATPDGLRDRAILLLGFAGALRRSEIVALTVESVQISDKGARLFHRKSKGDRKREGAKTFIARGGELCPVAALEAWLFASGIEAGPLFRRVWIGGKVGTKPLHVDTIRELTLRACAAAGVEAPAGERLSPHGLRSGCITQAYVNGATEDDLLPHVRIKDFRTLRGYVRQARLSVRPASSMLGL